MKNLEYKIGKLRINPNRLEFQGTDSYESAHKFLVESLDNSILIHVGEAVGHIKLGLRLNLPDEKIVGGGSCYLDKQENLVLDDYSGEYHAIPKEVAQRFVGLLQPEFEKTGVNVKGIIANPRNWGLHSFWTE